jgi:hypothetical protein
VDRSCTRSTPVLVRAVPPHCHLLCWCCVCCTQRPGHVCNAFSHKLVCLVERKRLTVLCVPAFPAPAYVVFGAVAGVRRALFVHDSGELTGRGPAVKAASCRFDLCSFSCKQHMTCGLIRMLDKLWQYAAVDSLLCLLVKRCIPPLTLAGVCAARRIVAQRLAAALAWR